MVNEIEDELERQRKQDAVNSFQNGEDLPVIKPDLIPITVDDCMEIIPRKYILEGLIEDETITLFSGREKIGKTYVLTHLALSMAAGLPWLDMPTMQDAKGRVLWLNLDMSRNTAKRRINEIIFGIREAYKNSVPISFENFIMFDSQSFRDPGYDNLEFFGDSNAVEALREFIIRENVKICFIDNLIQIEGAAQENSSNDIQRVFNRVKELRDITHCSFVLIHHTTKDGGRGRGSGDIFAETDLNLQLDPDINNENILKLKTDGARNSALKDIGMMKVFRQRIGEDGQPMTDTNGHAVYNFDLASVDSKEITTDPASVRSKNKSSQTIESNVKEIENYFLRNPESALSKTWIVNNVSMKGAKQLKFDSIDEAEVRGILKKNSAGMYYLNGDNEK